MRYKFLSGYHLLFWIGLIGIIIFIFLYTAPIKNILYLEFLLLPITLFILGFVSKYDKKIWKKAVIYFIIGLFWELLTEAMWTYASNFLLMFCIYKDIPLAMLFYWISVFSLAFFSFSYLIKKLRVNGLLAQIITIFSVFLAAESIGFNVLGLWDYNFNSIFFIPPYFLPPHIFIGYLVFGNLFLIFMRKKLYNPHYFINFISKLAENPFKMIEDVMKGD